MPSLTANKPSTLAEGVYWYVVPGQCPTICEKRSGEDFVRFTNGGRQSWSKEDEVFIGPLSTPEQLEAIQVAMDTMCDAALDCASSGHVNDEDTLMDAKEHLLSLLPKL